MADCTSEEKSINDFNAAGVEIASGAVAIVIGVAGAGITSPVSVGVSLLGETAAEGIRDHCRNTSEVGLHTVRNLGELGISTAANAFTGGMAGIAKYAVVNGIITAYDLTTSKIKLGMQSGNASGTAHSQLPSTREEPRQLLPEHLPALDEAAKRSIHAVIHHEKEAHGLPHSTTKPKSVRPSNGLY